MIPPFTIVLSTVILAAAVITSDAARKPNVVFILADDFGYTDLGCTGSDLYQTPNIDGFAKQSQYFSKAHSSHPTCSPSRAALMTGKYPARLGIVSHGKPGGVRNGDGTFMYPREHTLAESMRDAGYTTAHIGKWHVGMDGKAGPKEQGFQIDIASNQFCCPGSFFYPYFDKKQPARRQAVDKVPDLEDRGPGDHLTECLGDLASKFIAEHKDEPFFLNLCYYAVHTPIQAEKDKVAKYKKIDRSKKRHRHPAYAGLVEHLDDSVGQVLDAIEKNGLSDNTIVIFFSDNGGEIINNITSNHPFRNGKGTQYLGGVRVPLFIKWPGVTKAGSTSEVPVIGHDLYPTILAMTGVPGDPKQNDEMDGVNLAPLLKDPSASIDRDALHWLRYPVVFHYRKDQPLERGPCGTIIKGDWKLMQFFPTPHGLKASYQLYNLKNDIGEQHNLAASMPEKIEGLKRDMEAWRQSVNAPTYEDAYKEYEKIK